MLLILINLKQLLASENKRALDFPLSLLQKSDKTLGLNQIILDSDLGRQLWLPRQQSAVNTPKALTPRKGIDKVKGFCRGSYFSVPTLGAAWSFGSHCHL